MYAIYELYFQAIGSTCSIRVHQGSDGQNGAGGYKATFQRNVNTQDFEMMELAKTI